MDKKLNFSNKGLSSKCDQISNFLWIWPHLLKKSLMQSFIFGTVRKGGLTFKRPMFPSYRNQSADFQSKSTDWFLYDEKIER